MNFGVLNYSKRSLEYTLSGHLLLGGQTVGVIRQHGKLESRVKRQHGVSKGPVLSSLGVFN